MPTTVEVGSIVIFGGTFDPVHNAHLALAREALRSLEADRVLWLPTGNPGYREPPVASAAHRIAMLRLAIGTESRFILDERETRPGHSGYTIDTLRSLRAESSGGRAMFLLMGADQYAKFRTWRDPDEIAALCRIVVAARPGWSADDQAIHLPFAPQEISSTDIRARLGQGGDVSSLVPVAVLAYIKQKGLYGT